jgi:hypothetical protein
MRNDLADVTVIFDRSSSMWACCVAAESGINRFVAEQKKQPGECLYTLAQFDTECEFIHLGIPINDVPRFCLYPRGCTALYDSLGFVITKTGQRLAAMEESMRPGLVVCVIVTDGYENSSREFDREQIRNMIKHQSEVYNWKFTFLAANQDAFLTGAGLGIDRLATATYKTNRFRQALDGVASTISRMRHATHSGQAVDCAYTPEELRAMHSS